MYKVNMLKYNDLEAKVKNYIYEEVELECIKKAYDLASELHLGEVRKSGEPYIQHPLNVALILTEIKADYQTLAAALLHDTVEDTSLTLDEIEEQFGKEIALLVNGVTKINSLNFTTDNEALIENHRKILVGLSEDVRVIILKLADRLHNMRTLWALSERRQKNNAKETLEILTPIAHRLGIFKIKSELEDLSLRYLKPDAFYSIVEKLNQTKADRDITVTDMINDVSELLNNHDINHEIKGRAKSIYSIYSKLQKGKKFNDIFDLLALRIIVDTEQECYVALGLIHSKYRPIPKRFKDYVARPKTNMYQSLHTTVFGVDGYLFEIQIRTHEMDNIAESGIAAHWSYKEKVDASKQMQNDMEQKLQFFKSIMELQQDDVNSEEFVNQVKNEVLENNIYVFTPKGDVIELPIGSTPIDFAFKVHTKVGEKMVGAIVNNAIVPLDYELNNNDIIKINTSNTSSGPNKDWITIAKTSQAKNKIKSFFVKQNKDKYTESGNLLLQKELRKRKISYKEFFTDENVDKILKELKLNEINDVYSNIGSNKYGVNHVINIIYNTKTVEKDFTFKNKKTSDVIIKNDIIVDGIDDIKINLAQCCKPIMGDNIVGFITKGNGITVHKNICHNIINNDERLISLSWNEEISKKYPTTILINCSDDTNPLIDIITKINNHNASVENINTIHKDKESTYEIILLVENKDSLKDIMSSIMSINNVINVERLIK